MVNSPKIFIIILNYNGESTIKQCLNSVFQMDYPNFEVVVVDNNSSDGSLELAKGFFPKAHFIKNEKNVGFAAGNNVGVRFALEKMADYVFLLNNDALIKKDTLLKLVDAAEKDKNAGVVGPVIFKGNTDDIWFAGGEIKWLTMRAVHDNSGVNSRVNSFKTQYVSGCAMLIKKEVLKKTGLLSEDFFLYYEDVDFCVQAEKNGFYSLIVPGAEVFHFEKSEQNKKSKTYWLVISGLIFFKKNTPLFLKLWMYFYLFLRKRKNKKDVKNNNELAREVQRAYNDYKNAK
ncbi:N-acetylglucosaminyl-diphospho-decaprenol L-rhamnosyltransferase [bacterium BMS3Abin15]|nr:N-acetylglucosaminyl-diphospho-decaprenol L-rhamnosyltransferase [bacterium BMS3Abin15]HDH07468.1 glycosyltransferase family 2 protein [Candidatus Moranbacteria bacterium]HDZ86030.1 glycosyltransferase family 2 protein [Candidatus Moranbacteria bacterium]